MTPIRATVDSLYVFQTYQEMICDAILQLPQKDKGGVLATVTALIHRFRQEDEVELVERIKNFYNKLYYVVRKEAKLVLPKLSAFQLGVPFKTNALNILDALLMFRCMVNHQVWLDRPPAAVPQEAPMFGKSRKGHRGKGGVKGAPRHPLERKVDMSCVAPMPDDHVLHSMLESGWQFVFDVCDPGHWIDDTDWATITNEPYNLHGVWAQLWQQDNLGCLRRMVDRLINGYALYIRDHELMTPADLSQIVAALRTRHPKPFAYVHYTPPERRGLMQSGEYQQIVANSNGTLKFMMPSDNFLQHDAMDALRFEGFDTLVREHSIQRNRAIEDYEKKFAMTVEIPQALAGLFVGRDGSNIRKLREKTDTTISQIEKTKQWLVRGREANCDRVAQFVRKLTNNRCLPDWETL